MPVFEVADTVVLRANRTLIGVVQCIHTRNDEPLDNVLIVKHTSVADDKLADFLDTHHPPKHHVLIKFADDAYGHSLIHQDDLMLLDRSFALGDVVKRHDNPMLGNVQNLKETFLLQPVWMNVPTSDGLSTAVPTDEVIYDITGHVCSSGCPFGRLKDIEHPLQNCLLRNVPAEELKRAEDVVPNDLIVQHDWVGVVEDLKELVVLLLADDSIVVVKDLNELHVPICNSSKPAFKSEELRIANRPVPIGTSQVTVLTATPEFFRCGQLVSTTLRNLRLGRWLRGQFNRNINPEGFVLAVKTKSIDLRWLASNPFIPERFPTVDPPAFSCSFYENAESFPKGSELRSNKAVYLYDSSRLPSITESRTRISEDDTVLNQLPSIVHSDTEFRVGDHVKFRDQGAAWKKYQGVVSDEGISHGKFDRIVSTKTFGFDVNEFKVIHRQQECTVRWQDGTFSSVLSREIFRLDMFEWDLSPGALVVAREGMVQVSQDIDNAAPYTQITDFNEMNFFEGDKHLVPKRVGIVQSVDEVERFVQVRWFSEPKIELTHKGNVLAGTSRFGGLSDITETMSLYEVMTFPALSRQLQDIVIVPSSQICLAAVEALRNIAKWTTINQGQTFISEIGASDAEELSSWLQWTVSEISRDFKLQPRIISNNAYKASPTIDWVGEIVGLGCDGIITVRLNTRETCKDIRIEHDQFVCIIDQSAINGASNWPNSHGTEMDHDQSLDSSDALWTNATTFETVEYEGGERMDTDSGDDNWEDADDDNNDVEAPGDEETPIAVTRASTPSSDVLEAQQHHDSLERTKTLGPLYPPWFPKAPLAPDHLPQQQQADATLSLPTCEPPSFAILDGDLPLDQYQKDSLPSTMSSAFLKRIAREHKMLHSSLPQGEIYVRTYESRLDLMRCLILGPSDTPYEYAPFVIDLYLGEKFPLQPPRAHFHSWTSGQGRINPNLYEEGKICLSLLNTWPAKGQNEGWSAKSTILQLLVSLQGLVLVKRPFYNEAGFEEYIDDRAYDLESMKYNEKAFLMARGFVRHAMTDFVRGLEDVLAWIYLPHSREQKGLLQIIVDRSYALIEASEKENRSEEWVDGTGSDKDQTAAFMKLLSKGAVASLTKTVQHLEKLIPHPDNVDMN